MTILAAVPLLAQLRGWRQRRPDLKGGLWWMKRDEGKVPSGLRSIYIVATLSLSWQKPIGMC